MRFVSDEKLCYPDPTNYAVLSKLTTAEYLYRYRRLSLDIDQPFDEETELILHKQEVTVIAIDNMGVLLGEMSLWSFSLPYCEVLPDGNVMVFYYAGEEKLDIHWTKIRVD